MVINYNPWWILITPKAGMRTPAETIADAGSVAVVRAARNTLKSAEIIAASASVAAVRAAARAACDTLKSAAIIAASASEATVRAAAVASQQLTPPRV